MKCPYCKWPEVENMCFNRDCPMSGMKLPRHVNDYVENILESFK